MPVFAKSAAALSPAPGPTRCQPGTARLPVRSASAWLAPYRMWALAAVCACAVAAAHADNQTIYEWRDAQGVKSFSQWPPPPGTPNVTSREIPAETLTPAQRAAVKARLPGPDAAALAKAEAYQRQLAAADQAVNRALQALAQAEEAARLGRIPLPGETVGIVGGHARLRSDYFDRQSLLEQAVDLARTQLNEAYRQRDALMQ